MNPSTNETPAEVGSDFDRRAFMKLPDTRVLDLSCESSTAPLRAITQADVLAA